MTRIILIGYMGAGKTTLGKAVARESGLQFIDLDWYIEERFHAKVADIFAQKGEEGFREIERRMLHEVAEFENVIIACGGGTPCFFDNMDYLNTQGATIYLKGEPEVLQAHIGMGKSKRPLLEGKTPEQLHEFIKESLAVREPFYMKARYTLNIGLIETEEQIVDYAKEIIRIGNSDERNMG